MNVTGLVKEKGITSYPTVTLNTGISQIFLTAASAVGLQIIRVLNNLNTYLKKLQ